MTDVIEYFQRRMLVIQTLEKRTCLPMVAANMQGRAKELESLLDLLIQKERSSEQC